MANGHGKKIPEALWQEIYQLYASGTAVSTIRLKLKDDHQVEVSEATIYGLLRILRSEKQKQLNELLNAQSEDDVGRLNWLQNQLEELAVESRFNDKPFFLKVADKLIKIHQLKLVVRASKLPDHFTAAIDDNGRAKLLEELQRLS